MKIISVTMTRNESDILELFVRYHLRIVDYMIIIQHLSLDRTPEILEALKAEGLPLEIVRETGTAFDQSVITTQFMKRAVAEHGADWVLPLDVDEFLTANEGFEVRPLLEKLSPEKVHSIFWKTYIPRAEDPQDIPLLFERIQYRLAGETKPTRKLFVPKAIATLNDVFIGTGNHRIINECGRRHKGIRYYNAPHLHLAHFPVRSANQISTKILLGWPGWLASLERTEGNSSHFKKMFNRLRSGAELTPEDVEELGYNYWFRQRGEDPSRELVHDPIIPPGDNIGLRYHGACSLDLVSALADLAERQAQELVVQRKKVLALETGMRGILRKIRARLISDFFFSKNFFGKK